MFVALYFPHEICSGRMYVWCFLCYSLRFVLSIVVYVSVLIFFNAMGCQKSMVL
jgi:hypothetical protein